MSARLILNLEPETRLSMNTMHRNGEYACGCSPTKDGLRVWLCNYHEGFDDGAEAALRGRTPERTSE